jgi:hypothetical protein
MLVEECVEEEVWCIVFDTMVRAAWGLVDNENDNTQWMGFQAEVDLLKELAGVSNTIMVHHTGKSSPDRGRGATRIEDGNDDLWYLRRGEFDFGSEREFAMRGRWTEQSPIALKFDEDSGLYFWDGASAVESRVAMIGLSWMQTLVSLHAAGGVWPTTSEARDRLEIARGKQMKFIEGLEGQGLVRRVPGSGREKRIEVTSLGLEECGR